MRRCVVPAPEPEIAIDVRLVRRLLAAQHPELADLPLDVLTEGWDNVLVRCGDDLVARLPRRGAAARLVVHEQRWLPELAPRLPLPVPVPTHAGVPGEGYPWHWSVVPWFDGEPLAHRPPDDWAASAEALGTFLAALHQPAPLSAPDNPFRGTPLAPRTERLRSGLDALAGSIAVERGAVERAWEQLVDAPAAQEPPLWLHGDLHPLNVLVHRGRLAAIIDFGDMTAGDRATDLAAAWLLLPVSVRPHFRRAAGLSRPIDDATWMRAQAWALALGVAYLSGDPPLTDVGARVVAEIVADLA